ncbi:glycosyltransferase family 2 protein [Haladaptatus sp. NG-SE-30]
MGNAIRASNSEHDTSPERSNAEETAVAVIPAYNEGEYVDMVVTDIFETNLVECVVVVDDASEDDTAERAKAAGALILQNDETQQSGGAIKRGYTKAIELGADIVYRLDADGQHSPEYLGKFRDALIESNSQYVIGNRFADPNYRNVMPLDRHFGNRVVSLAISLRTRNWISDPTCGFRAVDTSLLRKLPFTQFSDDFCMDIEEILFAQKFGAAPTQVPVDCIYGDEDSSLSYVDGLRVLLSTLNDVGWSRIEAMTEWDE